MRFIRLRVNRSNKTIQTDYYEPLKGDWEEPYIIIDLSKHRMFNIQEIIHWIMRYVFTNRGEEELDLEENRIWFDKNIEPYEKELNKYYNDLQEIFYIIDFYLK